MFNLFGSNRNKNTKHLKKLAKKFQEKRQLAADELESKHKDALKWAKKKGIKTEDLVSKGARGLAAGAATSAMVITSGLRPPAQNVENPSIEKELQGESLSTSLEAKKDVSRQVREALNQIPGANSEQAAKSLSQILKIPLKTSLNGISLNTSYGIVGYESHLTRYPGDNISTHFETTGDFQRFSHAAMAGGPGAWGYIAPSQQALKRKDIERERYYLVAQTFLSPNWGRPGVKEWFRHRKMALVNPATGKVVIGALEDAGPEVWTGRSFGGSPEVMEALGFGGGGSQAYMFFVDDSGDKIPLGSFGL